jgi:cytochrome P450
VSRRRPAQARRNARYTPLDADGPLPTDMVRAVPAIRRDPLRFLQDCVDRHGDLVAFPMPRTPVLLVNDPGGVRRVLQEGHRRYGKQTVQYGALSMVTGSGLLTADGEEWLRRRRLVQPAFHQGGLPAVAQAAGAAAEQLRAQWAAAPDSVLDLDPAVLGAMLDVVGRTLFDADLAEVGRRVVAAVDDALQVVVARARSPLPGRLPTPSRARLRRAVAVLDTVCLDVVRRRREAGVSDDATDLLALLLRSTDGSAQGATRLTDRELRDELVTLVIAGHETVASALTWSLHLLSRDDAVQSRLGAELDDVLGGRAPQWADLPRLAYTRAVLDETLRLYPPAWVVTRRAREDDEVCGVRVPAGTMVIISPWLVHRRPRSWPDPQRFDPERFSVPAARAAARPDYLPFGAGPRLCIGREFALVEAVLVLAGLLRGRRVSPVDPEPPGVDALVTLRPRGGLRLRLTPVEWP